VLYRPELTLRGPAAKTGHTELKQLYQLAAGIYGNFAFGGTIRNPPKETASLNKLPAKFLVRLLASVLLY